MTTTLGQRCTVFLDEQSVQRFQITSSLDTFLPEDLPSQNVFVFKVILPEDPKSDTFLRVANVADLTTLPAGRETAAAPGATQLLYLSQVFTVTYDDIATASSAKLLIQQRVDNLIADWHAYNEQFLAPLTTPPDLSTIPLPLTDSIVSERQLAYNTAHAEYLAAQTAAAVAATTLTAAQTNTTTANDAAAQAVSDSQKCSTMQGHFAGANTAVTQYRAAVNNFISASNAYATATALFAAAADTYRAIAGDPSPAQEATYDAAKSTYLAAKSSYDASFSAMTLAAQAEAQQSAPALTAFQTEIVAACTTKIAQVAIAASKKTAADQAAAEAATEKTAADQAASTALLADTTAFLALQEVCPEAERTVP